MNLMLGLKKDFKKLAVKNKRVYIEPKIIKSTTIPEILLAYNLARSILIFGAANGSSRLEIQNFGSQLFILYWDSTNLNLLKVVDSIL